MPEKTTYVKLSQEPSDEVQHVQVSWCRELWSLPKKAVFKKILVFLAILQVVGIWSIYKRSTAYSTHSPNASTLPRGILGGLSNVSHIYHLPLTHAKDMGRFYTEVHKKNLWCLTLGTDLPESNSAGKCICKSGWNGLDCGVPPSVWNSDFLQQGEREGILIRRRKRPRRIVYSTSFESSSFGLRVLNFTVKYLSDVVEAFVVAQTNCSSPRSLASRLRSIHPYKIVSICLNGGTTPGSVENVQKEIWSVAKKKISDFRPDDIVVLSHHVSVPSIESLSFLKLYSGFSEPVFFSLLPVASLYYLGRASNQTSRNASVSSIAACTLEFLRYICKYEADVVWSSNDVALKKLVRRFEKNNWSVKSWVVGSQYNPAGWHCGPCLSGSTPSPTSFETNVTKIPVIP